MYCSCGHENPSSAAKCRQCGAALGGAALGGAALGGAALATGKGRKRLLIDASVAAGLLMALIVVFLIDNRSDTAAGLNPLENGDNVDLNVIRDGEDPGHLPGPMRIAVTPPVYDDMGRLLDLLGSGYRHANISMDDLLDSRRLAGYDVVFVTCGLTPQDWASRRLSRTGRRSRMIPATRPEIAQRIKSTLREYVDRGGTLYVSDWYFDLLAIAFPEFVDDSKVESGAVGTVKARVVDPGLRRQLGPTVDLQFDRPAWRPAAFQSRQVTTFLSGTYQTTDGRRATGPLLIQFPYGSGNVVFTSFHNEKQNSETELQLLRYLVFTTVTARTDAKIKRTMLRGGFSPVERNLLSASARQQSATQTYTCSGRRHLQFVLGFEDRGARLRLSVVGPEGREFQTTGTSTLTIDVADAEPGQWKYTVTPLKVPYENFPFTLTIGEKQ